MLSFRSHRGKGIVNKIIDNLPWELHIPKYKFCGPGTRLNEKIGEAGINPLDDACKKHDIAYNLHKDLPARHQADFELENEAWERVKSKDASLKEKAAAYFVTNAIKLKRKLGMGMKRKRRTCKRGMGIRRRQRSQRGRALSLAKVIRMAKSALKGMRPLDTMAAAKIAHAAVKGLHISPLKKDRIIPVPKTGGFLPLIPIFAGLSALGALAGGASAIVNTVNSAKKGKEELAEAQRHNRAMEQMSIGHGLYLRPYRSGCGIHVPAHKKKLRRRRR